MRVCNFVILRLLAPNCDFFAPISPKNQLFISIRFSLHWKYVLRGWIRLFAVAHFNNCIFYGKWVTFWGMTFSPEGIKRCAKIIFWWPAGKDPFPRDLGEFRYRIFIIILCPVIANYMQIFSFLGSKIINFTLLLILDKVIFVAISADRVDLYSRDSRSRVKRRLIELWLIDDLEDKSRFSAYLFVWLNHYNFI